MSKPKCLFDMKVMKDTRGHQRTVSLFYELRHLTTYKEPCLFTLKEHDFKEYTSMYKVYMDSDSEYTAALKLLGSWSHWKKLTSCNWFKPYIDTWREERETREQSLAKETLVELVRQGNVTAAKELNNMSSTNKRGRPSKQEIAKRAKKEASIDTLVSRGLEVINAGKDKKDERH